MLRNCEKASTLSFLYSQFPTLVAQNQSCTKFSWLSKVGCKSIIVKLVCPNFPSSKGSKIYGDEETLFVLENSSSKNLLVDALETCSTVDEFLHKLSDLFSQISQDNPNLSVTQLSVGLLSVSSQILSDLETVGWENVCLMSPDLRSVTLAFMETKDDRGSNTTRHTRHQLKIQFPSNYPSSPLILTHQLPDCWSPPLTTSLHQAYSSWQEAVQLYSPCWVALHDLDRLCWVLDPDMPNTQDIYRRLVVATSVSLHLVLDPSAPKALPSLRFLGADLRIAPLRESLAANMDLWDEEDELQTNLERVLGVEFPSKTDSGNEDMRVECGICYTYKLGDHLPTKNCDEPRCGQPFHSTCLYEWLVNLPGVRTTLNMVHGECPYCSKALQCSRPVE